MNLKDEELRQLYRAYVDQKIPRNRAGCPSLENLFRFFGSSGHTRKKKKIVDHVTSCANCAREFELLLELRRFQNRIILETPNLEIDSPSFKASILARLTAGLVWRVSSVGIGIGLVIASFAIILQKRGSLDLLRTTEASLVLKQPSQESRVALPVIFSWKEIAGAEVYVLEVFDETLLPIWKSPEVHTLSLKLPDNFESLLSPDKPYFWMVTAYAKKVKLAESNLSLFRILQKRFPFPP